MKRQQRAHTFSRGRCGTRRRRRRRKSCSAGMHSKRPWTSLTPRFLPAIVWKRALCSPPAASCPPTSCHAAGRGPSRESICAPRPPPRPSRIRRVFRGALGHRSRGRRGPKGEKGSFSLCLKPQRCYFPSLIYNSYRMVHASGRLGP